VAEVPRPKGEKQRKGRLVTELYDISPCRVVPNSHNSDIHIQTMKSKDEGRSDLIGIVKFVKATRPGGYTGVRSAVAVNPEAVAEIILGMLAAVDELGYSSDDVLKKVVREHAAAS
jgi:hypothetical protein